MSNKGNSKQVQVRTWTTTGPNKMTIVKETTYTTKTKTTITLNEPSQSRAVKGGNNYLYITDGRGGNGYNSYNGNSGRGGGRRW